MKIEVGKSYKSKSGNKCEMKFQDGPSFCGRMYTRGKKFIVAIWDIAGNSVEDSQWTIVSEWEEPKTRLLAWLDLRDRSVNFFNSDYEFHDTSNWKHVPWLDEPKTVEEHQDK